MEKISTKSLSKPLLLATPLFMIVMAILNSSDELSYLFVLDYVDNLAGSSDIIFAPSLQQVMNDSSLNMELLFNRQGYKLNGSGFKNIKIPLVKMDDIQKWQKQHELVKGVSPRWLIPITLTSKTDCLLLVMDQERELSIGLGAKSNLKPLNSGQVAFSKELLHRTDLKVGDRLSINLKFSNILSGAKLIQKQQQHSSKQQYATDNSELDINELSSQIYKSLNYTNLTEQQFTAIFKEVYFSSINKDYEISSEYDVNGLYPSILHNVILLGYDSFSELFTDYIYEKIRQPGENISQLIPNQNKKQWQLLKDSELLRTNLKQNILKMIQRNCLMAVSTFKNREEIYHPSMTELYRFSRTLQQTPTNSQVIAIYPLYKQLLGIRYFFRTIIQIFSFISVLLYFYTMLLIIKQLYEHKEIEVGIWRTLGAGGVSLKKIPAYPETQIFNDNNKFISLHQNLSFRQKFLHYYSVLITVGYLYYWLCSAAISTILYVIIKYIIFALICNVLSFDHIEQDKLLALELFFAVFLFTTLLAVWYIKAIYLNPLALTIKPVKRTFDEVKVRIIHVATFGITFEMLLVAIILVYYGVVSYYWIPYAVLAREEDLQVILFNSIFILMIIGCLMLLVVLQSRFQRVILRIIFMFNQRFKRMKLIMLKNIRAKQYRNIKMSLIIAITFAFLLVFTSGIKTQITIVKSFIERALGSDLVMQNYQKNAFNRSKLTSYLNEKQLKHSWFSCLLNSGDINFQLISQISSQKIFKSNFKVITANYLNSTYNQYYYPQQYLQQNSYWKLPNGNYDGFGSIYQYDEVYNNKSIGKYNENDTLKQSDPFKINLGSSENISLRQKSEIAPEEQVINIAVTSKLRSALGVEAGDMYKLQVTNQKKKKKFLLRARIVHSYKASPGFDIAKNEAIISQQQAKYLYGILNVDSDKMFTYEKLLIQGTPDQLSGVGSTIISMSPEHTQMFQIQLIKNSFSLFQNYLNAFILMITTIMTLLIALFIFIYTFNKCRDQAEMFKILRALGLSVLDIRIMIFLQILIRSCVSILNGIILGIFLSVGLSSRIYPSLELYTISFIALVMLTIFTITVFFATRYLNHCTVIQTNKL